MLARRPASRMILWQDPDENFERSISYVRIYKYGRIAEGRGGDSVLGIT